MIYISPDPIAVEDFHDADWVTANVYYTSKSKGEAFFRPEVVNIKTEQRYWHDSTSEISLKAVTIALGIPFYAMACVALNVVRLATLTISILTQSLVDLFTKCSYESFNNVVVNLTYEIPAAIIQTIWSVVKVPICAVGMEICAIEAIFSPLTGRVHVGAVEKFWRGTDRKHHLWEYGGNSEWTADFFTKRDAPYGFFLAYCFQPWGSLRDSHICKNDDGTPKMEILPPTC